VNADAHTPDDPEGDDALAERNRRLRQRKLDRHIVLVGFMGAGKSTVGRLLADEMQRPFLDSDTRLQEQARRSVQELFSEGRERAFRSLEEDVIADLLDGPPSVIALGGGALMSEKTRFALQERCFVIHLYLTWPQVKASLAELRVGRPLLQRPTAEIHELYIERQKTYRDADVRIHVPRDDPASALKHVLYAIRRKS
jgi:shikimate kinase